MNLVTGGAIVAAVMTGWSYIKELLGKVRSLLGGSWMIVRSILTG